MRGTGIPSEANQGFGRLFSSTASKDSSLVFKLNGGIHRVRSSASARRRTSSQGTPADSPAITRRARRSISATSGQPVLPFWYFNMEGYERFDLTKLFPKISAMHLINERILSVTIVSLGFRRPTTRRKRIKCWPTANGSLSACTPATNVDTSRCFNLSTASHRQHAPPTKNAFRNVPRVVCLEA